MEEKPSPSKRDLHRDTCVDKLVRALDGVAIQLERLFDNRTEQSSPIMEPDEAAAYLKIDRKQLLELARSGKIQRAKVGKFVRFRREDLDEFMRKGGTDATKNKRKNRFARQR